MTWGSTTLSATDYLSGILAREAIDRATSSRLVRVGEKIATLCDRLSHDDIIEVTLGGGYEKGLANRSGSRADYLVWFNTRSGRRIGDIYESMVEGIERVGLMPYRRDVGIAVDAGDMMVDIVPVKRLSMISDIHELHSVRRGRPITTNLHQHVLDAHGSGWQAEIRLVKLWRDQNRLDFPSFYLELATIAALRRRPAGALADNVWAVLGFLERLLVPRAMLDPANAANIVSDELTAAQKRAIATAAAQARSGKPWSQIVW